MGARSLTYRKPVGVVAAVAVSFSALFAGAPVALADPYDGDDGGGSSYDGGGDSGGGFEEPSGGGMQEPANEPGGGMQEPANEPGGGMQEPANEPGGGMQEPANEPGGGMQEPPTGGGGMQEPANEPGGGMHEPANEPGGGMHEPANEPGGGMQEPPGGGMHEPANEPGGGMHEPPTGGGGMQEPNTEGGGMVAPTETQASQQDYSAASTSQVVETTSTEVSSEEITSYQESISSTVSTSSLTTGLALSSPVALWNSSWISYDRYYRPVFTNPYRTPLSVLYDYGDTTQVFTVAPLQRAALNVPNAGVYTFTAMTRPASGPATNLSVGSFSGGGYQPGPGQAPPQRPAKLNIQKNVLVQVKFDRGSSEPFRVKTLIDLGSDPKVNGATKVLLDEEIPAWGQWSKTDKGEALFVINQTQTLPGVNPPAQEPLAGYNVQLTASAHNPSWIEKNKTLLISVAVGAGVLALAGVGFVLLTRRRRGAQ
ncbi:hypothetical protein [Mycolicibacterium sphagni]|uniref:hypothetical protein n=1 Tax=Mycolicibacterium sphagni TaxID=1786 RepID=UPI0013FD68BD|nr:hypothetical protein [Mycolicibacterium sphagni]